MGIRHLIVAASFLMVAGPMYGQGSGSTLSFGVHYGTFSMAGPKSFQKQVQSSIPHSQEVATFPAYWGYDGELYFPVTSRFRVGLFGGFNSTGGKVSYSDYSGTLDFTQSTQCIQLGTGGEVILSPENSAFDLFLSFRAGAILTKYSAETDLTVAGHAQPSQTVEFNSTSLMVSPGFGLLKNIDKDIFIKSEVRYLLDTEGELKDPDGQKLLITSNQGAESVSTDWSGIRVGIMIGFRIRGE